LEWGLWTSLAKIPNVAALGICMNWHGCFKHLHLSFCILNNFFSFSVTKVNVRKMEWPDSCAVQYNSHWFTCGSSIRNVARVVAKELNPSIFNVKCN
jgi:hypothetical protein